MRWIHDKTGDNKISMGQVVTGENLPKKFLGLPADRSEGHVARQTEKAAPMNLSKTLFSSGDL